MYRISGVRKKPCGLKNISCLSTNDFFGGQVENKLRQNHPSLLQPAGKRSARVLKPRKSCLYKHFFFKEQNLSIVCDDKTEK